MDRRTSDRLSFIVNTAYYAVIVVLVYLAIKYVAGWILPFLLAFVLVSVLRPVMQWTKRVLHIEREIVSLAVMLLIYILFVLLIVSLVTQLVLWTQGLLSDLPAYFDQTVQPAIMSVWDSLSRFIEGLPENIRIQVVNMETEVLGSVQTILLDLSQRGLSLLSGLTTRVPTFLIALIFTVMLSFFISLQYEKVTGFIFGLLPPKAQEDWHSFKKIIKKTVVQYLRALFTLMVITAAELSVGLLILGKRNAIGIALGIAVFDALPFVGTGAIMIPWVILELIQGNVPFGIGIGILYGIITLVRNIIEPKIISDKLGLNPIVSLVAIYLGFQTMGVLGMIVMPIIVQILFAMHEAGNFPQLQRFIPLRSADSPAQNVKDSALTDTDKTKENDA